MTHIQSIDFSQYNHLPRAACLVLIKPNNHIAVCSRRNSNIYGLPGGKLDPNETALQAAIRETGEETGVYVDFNNIDLLYSAPSFEETPFFVDTFISPVIDSVELKQMEEGIEVLWTTWEDFLKENAFPDYNNEVYNAYLNWTENKLQVNKKTSTIKLGMLFLYNSKLFKKLKTYFKN